MDELERRMERVLEAAREGMTPDAADMARSRRVLLAATAGLAVGVGTSSAAAASAAGTGAAGATKASGIFATLSGFGTGAKIVTAIAISATVGTAGMLATQSTPVSPRSTSAVSARAVEAVKAPVAPGTPAIPEAIAEPKVPATDSPVPSPAIAPRPAALHEEALGPDPLSAELALIESARQALKNGNPRQALTALSEHRTRFPQGVMAQERTALRALALCSLGDPKGQEEAQQFLEQTPGSPLAAHLRAGCK